MPTARRQQISGYWKDTLPLWRQSLEEVFREMLPYCQRRTLQPLAKRGTIPSGRVYGKPQESAHAQVGLPRVNGLDWIKALLG